MGLFQIGHMILRLFGEMAVRYKKYYIIRKEIKR